MIRQDLSTSYQEVRARRARGGGQGIATPAQVDNWHSVAGVRALQQVEPLRGPRTRDDRTSGLWLWGKRVSGRSFAAPRRLHGPTSPAALCLSPEPRASPCRAALAPRPLCSSGLGLPRPCPGCLPAAPHLRWSATTLQVCSRLCNRPTPLDLVQQEQPNLLSRFPQPSSWSL